MSKVLRRFQNLFVDGDFNTIDYNTFIKNKYFFENNKIVYLYFQNKDGLYTIVDFKSINKLINTITKEKFNSIRYYYMEYFYQFKCDNDLLSSFLDNCKNKGYSISKTYNNKYAIVHIQYMKEEIINDIYSMLADNGSYSKHYNTQEATIEDAKTIVEKENITFMVSDFETYFNLDFYEITGKDFDDILEDHCDFEFVNCDDPYCFCNEYSCNCDGSCYNCREYERTGGRSYYYDPDSCYASDY